MAVETIHSLVPVSITAVSVAAIIWGACVVFADVGKAYKFKD